MLEALWQAPAIPGLTETLFTVEKTWLGRERARHVIEPSQLNLALTRLEEAKLLTVNRDAANRLLTLDSHPLIREYFALRVQKEQPEAWRAAHRRLYEHLCATTKDGDRPTLEDLQPLYQAVAHGCQAGMQQEACDKVYFARIRRSNEHYSTVKLGAFGSELGAIACFFETPWSLVSPALTQADQAWTLVQSAYYLNALGRLTEALEPMRAGLEMVVKQENWTNAARGASNLSRLELTLGEVAGAVGDAKQSVTYADRSGDAFWRIASSTTQAEALHQAGCPGEAEARFREAEDMQVENQPEYPLLYSLDGFQYCDLLLMDAERGAWHTLLSRSVSEGVPAEIRSEDATSVASCRAVSERAEKMFEWRVPSDSLLDIALDHLTVGRAALYEFLLASQLESPRRRGASAEAGPSSPTGLSGGDPAEELAEEQRGLASAAAELDAAVDGLRRAGTQDHLPRGLLPRAWCSLAAATQHRVLHQQEQAVEGETSAQRDLDDAWEIAERGPMPLFLADIHLYRARLFHAATPYPWAVDLDGRTRGPHDDLAEARRLIEKHGYWRRKEELEDAEEAARDWPSTT